MRFLVAAAEEYNKRKLAEDKVVQPILPTRRDTTVSLVDLTSNDGYPAWWALLPGSIEDRIEISRDESQDAHARLHYIAQHTPNLLAMLRGKSIAEMRGVFLEAERAAPLPGATEVRENLENTQLVGE